jgi:hypothetical protein
MDPHATDPVPARSRDSAAGLKLLGGLLRLDALQPEGFTAQHLADHAGVVMETARAFLSPSKGPGYAEAVRRGKGVSQHANGGRPAKLYRLRSDGRADLLKRLADLRRELDAAANVPPISQADFFAPLDLLEATINELDEHPCNAEEWRARLAEARLELGGCEADLRALKAAASVHASDFAQRVQAAQARLNVVVGLND